MDIEKTVSKKNQDLVVNDTVKFSFTITKKMMNSLATMSCFGDSLKNEK